MLIEVKEIDYCRLNVQCEFEPDKVEEKRSEIIQFFKKSAVPGFRPGKAPLEAIKLHFKNKINDLTKNELARSAFHAAIAEKNIRPFGQPQFFTISLEGSQFKCNFCINQIPEVELIKYKGFDLPKGNIPDAIEMSEKILQELRSRNGETLPFGEHDFIQEGDSIIINYEGFLPDKENSVVKMDGEMFVVGKSPFQAFNENLLGMTLGERREFIGKIPDNLELQDLINQDVRFVVELVMASKSIPAPLDDVLAQKIGAKDVAELMTMTQGMASSRIQELEKKYLVDQISARLIEEHTLEIPTWLSTFEAELLSKQYGYQWDTLNDKQKNNFIQIATKNVKLSIILDKIREIEPDAQMSDEEVIKAIRVNISKYKNSMQGLSGKTDDEVIQIISQSGFMPALIVSVKDDFTMDFIIKNSNIIE